MMLCILLATTMPSRDRCRAYPYAPEARHNMRLARLDQLALAFMKLSTKVAYGSRDGVR